MQTMTVEVPNNLVLYVNSTPRYGDATGEKLQLLAAIGLFVSREVSLAKAAELAGQTLIEFMATLKFLGIPSVMYTEEMLADDIKFADRV